MNSINLAEVTDSGVAVVEPGMILDSIECEEFLELAKDLVSSQEGQCTIQSIFSLIKSVLKHKKQIELGDNQELLRNIHSSFQNYA